MLSPRTLSEINKRARKPAFAPLVVLGTISVAFLSVVILKVLGFLIGIVVLTIGLVYATRVRKKDNARRITSVTYEITDNKHSAALQEACKNLAQSERVWHVKDEQHTWDWKRNAGAYCLISRDHAQVGQITPPFISTNANVWGIDATGVKLFFFPDTALIFRSSKRRYEAVPYESLSVSYATERFIEERLPKDADVVGHTWQYIRKDGGPDLRFKDNRQLPIALYGLLTFDYPSGLGVRVQVSNTSLAQRFARVFNHLQFQGYGGNR